MFGTEDGRVAAAESGFLTLVFDLEGVEDVDGFDAGGLADEGFDG